MKRRDLISHLMKEGCILHREGAKHSVFLNLDNGHLTTVPRHRNIEILLARKICRQLDLPVPRARA
ncbi:MAG: type II toxin-antitoxin system HicA family toxin [Chloroflexi bacterium]|nr:type II toxin-antitoxin system HicA family toxin [Chloroflexota bacterium]